MDIIYTHTYIHIQTNVWPISSLNVRLEEEVKDLGTALDYLWGQIRTTTNISFQFEWYIFLFPGYINREQLYTVHTSLLHLTYTVRVTKRHWFLLFFFPYIYTKVTHWVADAVTMCVTNSTTDKWLYNWSWVSHSLQLDTNSLQLSITRQSPF